MKRRTTWIFLLFLEALALFLLVNLRQLMGAAHEQALALSRQAPTVEPGQVATLRTVLQNIHGLLGGALLGTAVLLGITILFFILRNRENRDGGEETSLEPLHRHLATLSREQTQLSSEVSRQQERAEQQEGLARLLTQRIPFPLLLTAPPDRLSLINPAGLALLGTTQALALNHSLASLLTSFPELRARILDPPPWGETCDIASQDHLFTLLRLPLAPSQKELGPTLWLIEDVTLREAELKKEQERKQYLALGEMASFMAHEVKNALGVIYGYTRTMTPATEPLNRINEEILFLDRMVSRFHAFAQPSSIHPPENLPLADHLKNLCTNHGLSISWKGPSPILLTDSILWEAAMDNLVRNAAQAGATSLSATFSQQETHGELFLEDDGPGIPTENREKIWLPFFTTREKGSGMGLPMVRKILHDLDCRISLADARTEAGNNPGTRFEITVPDALLVRGNA